MQFRYKAGLGITRPFATFGAQPNYMKIALITYHDQGAYASPTVVNEDDKLLEFLQHKGLNIEKVIWNHPQIQWENYDLAILKSPWDYFDLIADFYAWLEMLKAKNVRLLNPTATVKWNADKHYLQNIMDKGLLVTPSIFLEKDAHVNLNSYFDEFETEKLIVKPCVSGGAKNTFKVTKANVDEINAKLGALIREEAFIVQPFLAEIEENGEWSFLFFGQQFSHALLKKVKTGDFRVQHAHGGSIHPQEAPAQLLQSAQRYVDQFAQHCLYARVDGTVVNGEFLLMELELIEPFLFLDTDPSACERYYQALIKLIN